MIVQLFIWGFFSFWLDIEPPQYNCIYTTETIEIDGELKEEIWQTAHYLSPLQDIKSHKKPSPYHNTPIQLAWNDTHLFLAATIEDYHIYATYLEDESPLYQEDVFELFFDPDGDGKDYFELEINPLGTIWDLQLTAGYRHGGKAKSEWTCEAMEKAICINGSINQSTDTDQSWVLELAIPFTSLNTRPPIKDTKWRANFMRVDWELEPQQNSYKKMDKAHIWTWAEQGMLDIHLPEKWGILMFNK